MASVKLAFGVLCIVLTILGSGATKCYKCTGPPDGDCAKAIGPMEVEACQDISVCHYTDLRSGSERSVSRGCTKYGPVDLCTQLYQLSALNPMALRVFKCSTCWGDLCNVQVTK
ncbi:hypothetical protein RN001_003929 [Aquatica leii]|uniref:Sodefrin-like factor n=1 Tax=Aquatica leii TaxID=1421715 RepID=A0AAN7QPD1_9COLE|nr:hypothetical protein RN001_003929 [Aquatica leii]